MKFTCPVCETRGDLPEEDQKNPVTRRTCGDCGTILLINPDTGEVDAHKAPLKAPSVSETSTAGSDAEPGAVLAMRPKDGQARDRTAPVVVAVILIVLIAAGVYLTFFLDIF